MDHKRYLNYPVNIYVRTEPFSTTREVQVRRGLATCARNTRPAILVQQLSRVATAFEKERKKKKRVKERRYRRDIANYLPAAKISSRISARDCVTSRAIGGTRAQQCRSHGAQPEIDFIENYRSASRHISPCIPVRAAIFLSGNSICEQTLPCERDVTELRSVALETL